jgi:hypothetical protein
MGCCLLSLLLLGGARIAGIFWWAINPDRWDRAFNGEWIWPVLGIIFLPWTTIFWVLVAPTGNPTGVDWIVIAFGVFIDLASYGGSGYGNRNQIPGYS